jgi:hypothetical protein
MSADSHVFNLLMIAIHKEIRVIVLGQEGYSIQFSRIVSIDCSRFSINATIFSIDGVRLIPYFTGHASYFVSDRFLAELFRRI